MVAGKKRKSGRKHATSFSADIESTRAMAVDGDTERGRYAKSIEVLVGQEEFTLNFYSDHAPRILNSRIFITPAHAKRLQVLLGRQLKLHKKCYKGVK